MYPLYQFLSSAIGCNLAWRLVDRMRYYQAAANNSDRITAGLLLAIVGMSLVGITVALGG
ncbi:MAG: hypothetical protein OHK0047_18690 [Leptolyngbyaceae cyanobacterium]